jgi:protein-disulfide isomerase
MLLALILAVAILVAALMVLLSQLGGAGGSSASTEDVGKLYSGIPQNSTTLGKDDAPVTIYLYEDFQCPVCAQFSRKTFPEVVDRSVRGGEVKVVSEPLTFIGPDSVPAARAALAAGSKTATGPTPSCSSRIRARRTLATSPTSSLRARPKTLRGSMWVSGVPT